MNYGIIELGGDLIEKELTAIGNALIDCLLMILTTTLFAWAAIAGGCILCALGRARRIFVRMLSLAQVLKAGVWLIGQHPLENHSVQKE